MSENIEIFFVGIFFTPFFLFLYFLPTIFAFHNEHKKSINIFIYNFILGWTIIGWLILILRSLRHGTEYSKEDNELQNFPENDEIEYDDIRPIPRARCEECGAPAIPGDNVCYSHIRR